jgi:hypothetical protein
VLWIGIALMPIPIQISILSQIGITTMPILMRIRIGKMMRIRTDPLPDPQTVLRIRDPVPF